MTWILTQSESEEYYASKDKQHAGGSRVEFLTADWTERCAGSLMIGSIRQSLLA
jgi:hypothetical protein